MHVIYTAENFNQQAAPNLNLALAINEKACAFAVHTDDGILQLLGHYEFYVSLQEDETVFFDLIRSQDVLRAKYKTVKVILQGHKCTLVPGPLYDELYIENYLRHQHEVDKDEVAKSSPLFNGETQLVFATKEYLFYPARSKYYDAVMEPRMAHYLRKSARFHPNRLNVFIDKNRVHLVHCHADRPVYYNNFEFNSVDEISYYILNYYHVFSVPHQSLPVLLHGNVHPQLSEILRSYMGRDEMAPMRNRAAQAPDNFEFAFLIDFCH